MPTPPMMEISTATRTMETSTAPTMLDSGKGDRDRGGRLGERESRSSRHRRKIEERERQWWRRDRQWRERVGTVEEREAVAMEREMETAVERVSGGGGGKRVDGGDNSGERGKNNDL
ncbi:unnamed protein product [Linum trigynum]|uniref:Uncharacterized protein n=1 Tax=Linum trigynum TaxID=586398 RepID=A0AAV2DWS9_9ROSI